MDYTNDFNYFNDFNIEKAQILLILLLIIVVCFHPDFTNFEQICTNLQICRLLQIWTSFCEIVLPLQFSKIEEDN